MIEQQNQLEHEVHPLELPSWNRGYREALIDVLKEIESDE